MRQMKLYKSVFTPPLFGGVETLYWYIILATGFVPMLVSMLTGGLKLSYMIGSGVLMVFTYMIGIFLASKNPYMFSIILRHIQYQPFYPAREKYSKFNGHPLNIFHSNKKYRFKNIDTPNTLPK
jgi:type IV secretory pathway TrbD component